MKSGELNSAMVLLAGLGALAIAGKFMLEGITGIMTEHLSYLYLSAITKESIHAYFITLAVKVAIILAPVLLAMGFIAFAINVAQVGFLFSFISLQPDLKRIDPISGLSRAFSRRGFVELAKSIAKVWIVGYVVYSTIRKEFESLYIMMGMDASQIFEKGAEFVRTIGFKTGTVLIILGVADYIYQRYEFEKNIRMTKEEVKEEMKDVEGDPLIRSRIRSKQREMALKRMMFDVPKADVVVTNPTHYAVALKYDQSTMNAPKVLAKGKNLIAEKIKSIARENGVPIVENKPLARALHDGVEVGQEIPAELYNAVAEVLAFVYRMNKMATKKRPEWYI